jgi:phage repressor protein C with HTH and peptisase S24 domain
MSVIEARTAEFVLLEAHLPGLEPIPAGILLFDPSASLLDCRFRRDWETIAPEADAELLSLLEEDLQRKARELGSGALLDYLESNLSNTLRVTPREAVLLDRFDRTLERLYRKHIPAEVLPFRTHLPIYSCRAAAGRFGEHGMVEPEGWEEIRDTRLTEDMFLAHVVGHSMEPKIPSGSLCLFRFGVTGSRQGRLVLVEDFHESDLGGRYTVKRYTSRKVRNEDGWQHAEIVLEPLNPAYNPVPLEEGTCRILAEFLRVVRPEE